MTLLGKAMVHPEDHVDVSFDWTEFLDGQTITNSVWAPSSGLTVDSSTIIDNITVARVSGVTEGQSYYLQNRITLSGGQIKTVTVEVVGDEDYV